MKTFKTIVLWALFMALAYLCLSYNWPTLPSRPEPRIPSIIELQEAVGAEPDGIVGPDTIAKWDKAYANQEAAKFMTPSGGKED